MRSYLKPVLIAANLILAVALMTRPAASQVDPLSALSDCCQGVGEDAYCCFGCCWFLRDCVDDGHCQL